LAKGVSSTVVQLLLNQFWLIHFGLPMGDFSAADWQERCFDLLQEAFSESIFIIRIESTGWNC